MDYICLTYSPDWFIAGERILQQLQVKMAVSPDKTYYTTLFERQLRSLRRSDKRGAAAAVRAEKLICAIASGQLSDEEMLTKQTKNGELRLKCRKFDLGGGYRLISLREKDGLYFTFAGTHDACDRWLGKRRTEGLSLNPAQLKPVSVNPEQVSDVDLPAELLLAEAEYEAYIDSKLDEKTLRYLFRGMCGTNT
jgi:hypothetical protein